MLAFHRFLKFTFLVFFFLLCHLKVSIILEVFFFEISKWRYTFCCYVDKYYCFQSTNRIFFKSILHFSSFPQPLVNSFLIVQLLPFSTTSTKSLPEQKSEGHAPFWKTERFDWPFIELQLPQSSNQFIWPLLATSYSIRKIMLFLAKQFYLFRLLIEVYFYYCAKAA